MLLSAMHGLGRLAKQGWIGKPTWSILPYILVVRALHQDIDLYFKTFLGGLKVVVKIFNFIIDTMFKPKDKGNIIAVIIVD